MRESQARLSEFESQALPHLNDLYRCAARMLGDRGRAEDAVQETCLEAWRCFDRFEQGTNCRAWLFKILFHRIMHQRRKWYHLKWADDGEDILARTEAPPEPLSEHLTDTDILQALDNIPEQFRSVVLLADVQEFAYKEVANILAIPIGTVMSRLSRGRTLLRDRLRDVAKTYGVGTLKGTLKQEERTA